MWSVWYFYLFIFGSAFALQRGFGSLSLYAEEAQVESRDKAPSLGVGVALFFWLPPPKS